MNYKYDFAVNAELLEAIDSEMVGTHADNVRTKINEIYDIIDNKLAEHWKSTAYDDFKAGCDKYKPALEELANMIETFGVMAGDIGEKYTNEVSKVNSSFQI